MNLFSVGRVKGFGYPLVRDPSASYIERRNYPQALFNRLDSVFRFGRVLNLCPRSMKVGYRVIFERMRPALPSLYGFTAGVVRRTLQYKRDGRLAR